VTIPSQAHDSSIGFSATTDKDARVAPHGLSERRSEAAGQTFLAHDESQIEYCAEMTKRMPGPVLTRHQLVRRDGAGYQLIPDVRQLKPDERDELLRLCDAAVENYTGRRGRKLYDHRRIALGDMSGTAR
jgi:hypothetical protein